MTGLDQDMMQKNLSCRTLKEAQKNMYLYGFSFIPLNFLLLCLGVLLLALAGETGTALPPVNDDILPMFALQGHLGQGVFVLFTIGMIAATFSNADSALTAMTTSVCVTFRTPGISRRRWHGGSATLYMQVWLSFWYSSSARWLRRTARA